jgi:hypothetical protein
MWNTVSKFTTLNATKSGFLFNVEAFEEIDTYTSLLTKKHNLYPWELQWTIGKRDYQHLQRTREDPGQNRYSASPYVLKEATG